MTPQMFGCVIWSDMVNPRYPTKENWLVMISVYPHIQSIYNNRLKYGDPKNDTAILLGLCYTKVPKTFSLPSETADFCPSEVRTGVTRHGSKR